MATVVSVNAATIYSQNTAAPVVLDTGSSIFHAWNNDNVSGGKVGLTRSYYDLVHLFLVRLWT
jgi:hypothetical protein